MYISNGSGYDQSISLEQQVKNLEYRWDITQKNIKTLS